MVVPGVQLPLGPALLTVPMPVKPRTPQEQDPYQQQTTPVQQPAERALDQRQTRKEQVAMRREETPDRQALVAVLVTVVYQVPLRHLLLREQATLQELDMEEGSLIRLLPPHRLLQLLTKAHPQ